MTTQTCIVIQNRPNTSQLFWRVGGKAEPSSELQRANHGSYKIHCRSCSELITSCSRLGPLVKGCELCGHTQMATLSRSFFQRNQIRNKNKNRHRNSKTSIVPKFLPSKKGAAIFLAKRLLQAAREAQLLIKYKCCHFVCTFFGERSIVVLL